MGSRPDSYHHFNYFRIIFKKKKKRVTDQRTDRQTDTPSYKDRRTDSPIPECSKFPTQPHIKTQRCIRRKISKYIDKQIFGPNPFRLRVSRQPHGHITLGVKKKKKLRAIKKKKKKPRVKKKKKKKKKKK